MSGKSIDKWNKMYECLKFAKENPNNINRIGYSKLSGWVSCQKNKYKEGKLTSYEIKLLEELGIDLSINTKEKDINWDDAYSYLEEYFAENGNISITNTYITKDGFKLGKWLGGQKVKYNEGKLSLDKSNRLNSLYVIWSVRDNNIELKSFCEKYHIDYSLNKEKMSKLPINRIEFMINYLVDRDISYINENGCLLDIIFVPYIENIMNQEIEDDYSYMIRR